MKNETRNINEQELDLATYQQAQPTIGLNLHQNGKKWPFRN